MKRIRLGWSVVVGVVAVLGLAWMGREIWRIVEVRRAALARLPAAPDLSAFPSELKTRVGHARTEAQTGWRPLRGLGELATLYHANGFYAEASLVYAELARLEDDNPRWPHLLAGVLAGYGRMEEALPLLRRTVRLAPDYLPAQIRLGDALLKTNLAEDARRAYSAVLAREPDNVYAHLGWARLDLDAGNWTEARARVQRVVTAQPTFGSAWFLLATIDEKLGDPAAAAADRERVGRNGRFREMPDPWTDAVTNDCYDVYRLRVVAGAAANAGETALAQRWLERALALAPGDAAAERQLGNLFVQTEDLPGARRHLERAVALAPEEADNWNYLIAVLNAQGDEQAAQRAVIAGLSHCPQSPGLRYEQGRRLSAAGRWDEAIGALQEARRLRPEAANASVELAMIHFHLGRTDEALAELRGALAVEPGHPLALIALARAAIEQGDEGGAGSLLRRARQQPKVLREDLEQIARAYRDRFGRTPW